MNEVEEVIKRKTRTGKRICPNCWRRGYQTELIDPAKNPELELKSYACKVCLCWWTA